MVLALFGNFNDFEISKYEPLGCVSVLSRIKKREIEICGLTKIDKNKL